MGPFFAGKYKLVLPPEEELQAELEREISATMNAGRRRSAIIRKKSVPIMSGIWF
jgi:hypothetical protein